MPQENTALPVRMQAADKPQASDNPPDFRPEMNPTDDFIPTETLAPAEKESSFKQRSSALPDTTETAPEQVVSVSALPEQKQIIDAPETERPREIKSAPVRTAPEAKENVQTDSAPSDLPEPVDFKHNKSAVFTSETHRQAAQLAQELPAETNIAISVTTQAPEIKSFVLPQKENSRAAGIKKTENGNTETTPALFGDSDLSAAPEEKTLTPHFIKTEHSDPSEKPAVSTDQPDNPTVPYTESKVLPVAQNSVPTEGTVSEISAQNVTNAPAAAFSATHELRGKAVSGNTPVQKNIPVNELVDQIKVNIKKAIKDGLDKIDIIVKPKELGTIKIHLEIGKDGSMKAVLHTARAETLDLLQSDLTALKQALADSGFDLNDQSFSFNYRGERYNDEQNRSQNKQHDFSAERAEDESAEESAGSLSISGHYALNIRV